MKVKFWEKMTARQQKLVLWLLAANGVSVLLFLLRVVGADSYRYWFLLWNLVLAWVPPVLALLLESRLKTVRWVSGWNVVLSLLWLLFLPNSFYVLSDLIHLHSTGEVGLLYDAVLFCSFIFNAFIAGYLSVYIVHRALARRMLARQARAIILSAFLLCGYAIYLGRAMRWNTWDVFLHPAGILFDTSEAILHPLSHLQVLVTTGSFFLLLSVTYGLLWNLAGVLRETTEPDQKRK